MRDLIADMRYGARQLLRHPAFALSAFLSLALGLGVNVTIFGLAAAMLLRALQSSAVTIATRSDSARRPCGWCTSLARTRRRRCRRSCSRTGSG